MPVWLIRAGGRGEFEQKFLSEGRVYVTWDDLNVDLRGLPTREDLQNAMTSLYPEAKAKAILNWASQVHPFAHRMAKGDLVVLPLKTQPAIAIGEITGPYHHASEGPNPYYHWRPVKWLAEVPRDHFGQDLLYSFGAFLTICQIKRNNAEARLLAMRKNSWAAEEIEAVVGNKSGTEDDADDLAEGTDLEEVGNDQIAKLISARFKGHDLTRLVDAVLRAQGYTTWRSPSGADGGVDILAGSGPLGFGAPRLCVEVKSEASQIDRPAVDKLLGAMTKFGADQGLFVAWGGFKTTVPKEMAPSYFRMRLWTRRDFLEQLFANYDRLDEEIRAELPLKRVWTVALQE